MSSVKRYEVNGSSSFYEDEKGSFVDYEDYAALEAKCAALAAELNVVEAIHNDAVFITDDHYEQCPPEVQKIIRSLAVMQIPSYKEFLAEVRDQGVDMFALMFAEEAIKTNNITTGWRAKASRAAFEYAEALREDAAQLRKGVHS